MMKRLLDDVSLGGAQLYILHGEDEFETCSYQLRSLQMLTSPKYSRGDESKHS